MRKDKYDRAVNAAIAQVVASICAQVDPKTIARGTTITILKPVDSDLELNDGFYAKVMEQLNQRWEGVLYVTSINVVSEYQISLTT